MASNSLTAAKRYFYGPPWWLVLWCALVAIAFWVLVSIGWLANLYGGLAATIFALLTLLLLVRRVVLKRYLVVKDDCILLPTGLLHLSLACIPYASIRQVRESRWGMGTVLYIGADKQMYEIACGLHLAPHAYAAVRDHLMEVVDRNAGGR